MSSPPRNLKADGTWTALTAIDDDDALEDWLRFAAQAVAQRPLKPEKPARPRKTPAKR